MYNEYLSLVKAALWAEPDKTFTVNSERWLEFVRLNIMQGTGPLVFPHLLAQADLPSTAKMQMKSVCLTTMQQQVQLQYTLETAWRALESAGIKAVLMKGAGLAAFYPEPQCRPWGDIDLYVGPEQYHPACAVMRDTFPNALKFDEELDHYKHYNLIADGVSIEVHRVTIGLQHPADERRYARMEHTGMKDSRKLTVNGFEVSVFEPTFNALLIMFHSWEHMLTKGANLRQVCDLTLLLHHYTGDIDRPRLKRWLKSLHLLDVWQLFMGMAVDYLRLPQEEAPFYTDKVSGRAERLMKDLLAGQLDDSLASHKGTAPTNRILRKFHTMQERLANARRMQPYSPSYARHMAVTTLLHGALRFFAKDRHWE